MPERVIPIQGLPGTAQSAGGRILPAGRAGARPRPGGMPQPRGRGAAPCRPPRIPPAEPAAPAPEPQRAFWPPATMRQRRMPRCARSVRSRMWPRRVTRGGGASRAGAASPTAGCRAPGRQAGRQRAVSAQNAAENGGTGSHRSPPPPPLASRPHPCNACACRAGAAPHVAVTTRHPLPPQRTARHRLPPRSERTPPALPRPARLKFSPARAAP